VSEDWPRGEAERIARELWQGDLLATSVAVVLEAPGSTLVAGAESLETVDAHGGDRHADLRRGARDRHPSAPAGDASRRA
jgi:hypothetical protein